MISGEGHALNVSTRKLDIPVWAQRLGFRVLCIENGMDDGLKPNPLTTELFQPILQHKESYFKSWV